LPCRRDGSRLGRRPKRAATFDVLVLLLGLVLGGYFLPTIVAIYRQHPNIAGILLLNLFLVWTLIGWVGALVWSVISLTTRERVIYVHRE
jgi:hypothetical protein